jgi:hypothetical protein
MNRRFTAPEASTLTITQPMNRRSTAFEASIIINHYINDEPTIYSTRGGYARHSGLEPTIYHTLGGYARHSGLEPTIYHTLGGYGDRSWVPVLSI